MPETRTILFLGASYAGLSSSHYFLRHVYPHLPTDPKIQYRVLVVDPSSKFFARHASPRALIRQDLVPLDQIFLDIAPGYEQYGDKVGFVQGKATAWDDKARTVVVEKADGKVETVAYWALILATGTKTYSPLFSLQGGDYKDIEQAMKTMNAKVAEAKDVVVVGGGPAGVETAGEIGESTNGVAGWFASRPANVKTRITLITSASKLLPGLRQAISDDAEKFLNRVGADVRYNTKLYSTTPAPNGRTKVLLHDGEEMEADIVIPATGVQPMSEYVPAHLKNAKGYIIQNGETLRVDAAGPRVYAIGDVGSYSRDTISDMMNAVPVMETNLKRDLLAAHAAPEAKASGKDRVFKQIEGEMQFVPVGRSKGVGALFGWRVPSFFVWLIKGRTYMVSVAAGRVTGADVAKEKAWKEEGQ